MKNKSRLPKSIFLLGREIHIVEQSEIIFEDDRVEGLYEHSNKRMLIETNQNPSDKFETVLHEAAHSYLTQLGIDQTLNKREVESCCQIMTMYAVDIIKGFSPKPRKKK
jgi:hypothetical protein